MNQITYANEDFALHRIPSLTERALLHPYALNLLCPPNCEKKRVQDPYRSIIHTLMKVKKNPFNQPIKTSFTHWAMKSVRMLARMVYTIAVTVILGAIGTLWHAIHTGFHKCKTWAASEQLSKKEALLQAKLHKQACYTDLKCLAYGTLVASFAAGGLLLSKFYFNNAHFYVDKVESAFLCVVAPTFTIGGLSILTEAFQPSIFIPKLVAEKEAKAGMYLSLTMRDELGICAPDGGILPFNRYDSQEHALQNLGELIRINEEKILENEAKANAVIKYMDSQGKDSHIVERPTYNYGKKIYSVHGEIHAKFLEEMFTIYHEKRPGLTSQAKEHDDYEKQFKFVSKLSGELRMYDKKVKILKNFYEAVQTVEGDESPLMFAAKSVLTMGHSESKDFSPKIKICFIPEKEFEFILKQKIKLGHPFVKLTPFNSKHFFEKIDLEAINPEDAGDFSDSVYNQFKQRVLTNKWNFQNGQKTCSMEELLGLSGDSSFADYRHSRRMHLLALHPDKAKQEYPEDEAKKLFQFLKEIKETLDKKFEE